MVHADNPESGRGHLAGIIKTLMTVLTPVIFIVNKLSMGLLILLRVNPNANISIIWFTQIILNPEGGIMLIQKKIFHIDNEILEKC